MNKTTTTARRMQGFSLLEIMFVVLILSLVLAVVFTQIDRTQEHFHSEDMKLDLTQGTRAFMNQFAHDLHSEGYPASAMFSTTLASPALQNPAQNDYRVAVGLVKAAYDELWFEGDINNDGTVWVVDYKLLPNPSTGTCPCTIGRSVIQKVNGDPLSGQGAPQYTTALSNVINSGGANGGASGTPAYAISGSSRVGTSTQSDDTLFSSYKSANLFTYYDATGNEITPTDITGSTISNIATVRINLNVLAPETDLQTGLPPVMSYSAALRLPGE